jgi:hypothetical protein
VFKRLLKGAFRPLIGFVDRRFSTLEGRLEALNSRFAEFSADVETTSELSLGLQRDLALMVDRQEQFLEQLRSELERAGTQLPPRPQVEPAE